MDLRPGARVLLAGRDTTALAAVTVDEVTEASRRYLAPEALTTVVVGDADQIAGPLRALGPVEVTAGSDSAS